MGLAGRNAARQVIQEGCVIADRKLEAALPPAAAEDPVPRALTRGLSQLDSFVPWAGYTTVDVFTSVEQEYFAIRNASLALRPDADGEVPGLRCGRAALPSIAW